MSISSEPAMIPQAAIGFRAFKLTEDGHLRSTGLGKTTWRAGTNVSYCQSGHFAPQEDCSCGFYACYTPFEVPLEPDCVLALVAGRGDVLSHQGGFRCAEAQILALCAPWRLAISSKKKAMERQSRKLSALQTASYRYGVEVHSEVGLAQLARDLGGTVRRPEADPVIEARAAAKMSISAGLVFSGIAIFMGVLASAIFHTTDQTIDSFGDWLAVIVSALLTIMSVVGISIGQEMLGEGTGASGPLGLRSRARILGMILTALALDLALASLGFGDYESYGMLFLLMSSLGIVGFTRGYFGGRKGARGALFEAGERAAIGERRR